MKRLLLLAVCITGLTGSMALASFYHWNSFKRPPVSMAAAIRAAEKALGEDAKNRYCLNAKLYGDRTGDGKEGGWILHYSASDGSMKHVRVTMQGKTEVISWHGPIDWKKNAGQRKSFDDIRKRLEELFKQEGLPAEIRLKDNGMVVAMLTRQFEVYPATKFGVFGEKLEKVEGPSTRGFVLELRKVAKPEVVGSLGPDRYWMSVHGNYRLGNGDYFSSDMRYGREMKYPIVGQIDQILGEAVNVERPEALR